MNRRKTDMADVFGVSSIVSVVLMVVMFFSSCATKTEIAGSNEVIREPDKDHELHGEVGATYGQGMSRR